MESIETSCNTLWTENRNWSIEVKISGLAWLPTFGFKFIEGVTLTILTMQKDWMSMSAHVVVNVPFTNLLLLVKLTRKYSPGLKWNNYYFSDSRLVSRQSRSQTDRSDFIPMSMPVHHPALYHSKDIILESKRELPDENENTEVTIMPRRISTHDSRVYLGGYWLWVWIWKWCSWIGRRGTSKSSKGNATIGGDFGKLYVEWFLEMDNNSISFYCWAKSSSEKGDCRNQLHWFIAREWRFGDKKNDLDYSSF